MAKPCFGGLLTYWGVPMSALHNLLQLTEGGCHFDIVVPVATKLRTYSLMVVFTSQFHCVSKCELDMKNKVFWSACPDVGFGMAYASDKSPYNAILCFI